MPSSMHNVIVLAHVIILSFMCACCKANLIIIIIIIVFHIGNKEFIIARLMMRCMTNCLRLSSAC